MPRSEVLADPWAAPRRRAETLRERHPFAGEVLTLYLALLDVWERSWLDARASAELGDPERVAGWAADRVLPRVLEVTAGSGPRPLAQSLPPAVEPGAATELMTAWLAGEELVPVERYLARASLYGVLQASDATAACALDPSPRGERRCPRCGGPPQLSYRTDSGDQLVSGHRRLRCARCAHGWSFSSSACAYCGETARRTVYTERREGTQVGRGDDSGATFPHLRVEACSSCRRYLIDVDLGRDPLAVAEVDELAALPLDLYAAEQGLSKITPNLMGF
jgi:Protein involved in formate dehydrogenase formation